MNVTSRSNITRRTNTTYTVLQASQVSVLSRYLTLYHCNLRQVLTTELKLQDIRDTGAAQCAVTLLEAYA